MLLVSSDGKAEEADGGDYEYAEEVREVNHHFVTATMNIAMPRTMGVAAAMNLSAAARKPSTWIMCSTCSQ